MTLSSSLVVVVLGAYSVMNGRDVWQGRSPYAKLFCNQIMSNRCLIYISEDGNSYGRVYKEVLWTIHTRNYAPSFGLVELLLSPSQFVCECGSCNGNKDQRTVSITSIHSALSWFPLYVSRSIRERNVHSGQCWVCTAAVINLK